MIAKMMDVARSTNIVVEEATSTTPDIAEPVSIFNYLSCCNMERLFVMYGVDFSHRAKIRKLMRTPTTRAMKRARMYSGPKQL